MVEPEASQKLRVSPGGERIANLTTFSDTQDLPFIARSIYCGETCALSVQSVNGDTAVFAVQAGTYITGFFLRVRSTGTTSTTPANFVIQGE